LRNDATGITECEADAIWNTFTLKMPIFKFSIISSMFDTNKEKIPYLEYQFLTSDLPFPPSNVSDIIKAEGFSGSYKQVIEVQQPHSGGFINYVIQQ